MDKRIENLLNLVELNNEDKIVYHGRKIYKLFNFLSMIKKTITDRDLSYIKSYIRGFRLKRYEKKFPLINVKFKPVLDKKIAIYTCIIGDYDKVNEPIYFNDNVDYILFTDKKIKSKFWKVKKIPYKILELKNSILINRYIKLHPNEFLKGYDYSIYIDGNVKTVTDISGFTRCVHKKTGLAMFKHHSRECIYVEEKACLLQNKGNKEKIKIQINNYKEEGFPSHFGLLEGTIVVTDLKNKKSRELLIKWWNEFLKSESMRDQISLPYVLWKNNYSIDDIGFLGNNIRKCPKLQFTSHKQFTKEK